MLVRSLTMLGVLAGFLAGTAALSHDGVVHKSKEEAAAHRAATATEQPPELPADLGPATPFPIDIEASFDLIDQSGTARTEADYAGKPMLIFFGYASRGRATEQIASQLA